MEVNKMGRENSHSHTSRGATKRDEESLWKPHKTVLYKNKI
jgi:hypothetical protein